VIGNNLELIGSISELIGSNSEVIGNNLEVIGNNLSNSEVIESDLDWILVNYQMT